MNSRTDYIVYGFKLPEMKDINLWDDKYLPYIEGHPGIEYTIIRGEEEVGEEEVDYVVFGKLIGMDNDGWNFKSIDFKRLFAKDVQEKYTEVFGIECMAEPNLFIFSNYS